MHCSDFHNDEQWKNNSVDIIWKANISKQLLSPASIEIIHKFVEKFRDSSPRSVMPTLIERGYVGCKDIFAALSFLKYTRFDL